MSKRIVLTVTPDPRLTVVRELPALLNVAVSAVPGTGETDQLVVVDHRESVVPFQVPLAAHAETEPTAHPIPTSMRTRERTVIPFAPSPHAESRPDMLLVRDA